MPYEEPMRRHAWALTMPQHIPMILFALARRLGWAPCAALALAGCTSLPLPVAPADPPVAAQATARAPAVPLPDATPATPAPQPADRSWASEQGNAADALPVPVDPVTPERPVNLEDQEAHADLWARVRRGFAIPTLDTELVHQAEQWYATRPDYVQRMTERGGRYLFHIVEEVERRGMPTELALLPFVESAFNPRALSSAKASGIWQFMPATGRHFELRQNVFRDDRRDVLASTRAALDYLSRLYTMFGDWQLALAAYNWGEGNVQRAIARNQRAGRPTDYLSLRMPGETQYYVPKLQAVKNIISRPQDYGLSLPPVANHPYFLSVPVTRDIDVDMAARMAGMRMEEFQALNPQLNKPVILAAGTPYVLLPYDNANQFVRAVIEHRGPLASWTAWVAPRTLRPADAAKQLGLSEARLREVNDIPPRMLVRAGSTLVVPRNDKYHDDVSEHIADNAKVMFAPDSPLRRKVSLKAGRKDTVVSVARGGLRSREGHEGDDTPRCQGPSRGSHRAQIRQGSDRQGIGQGQHSSEAYIDATPHAAVPTTRLGNDDCTICMPLACKHLAGRAG
jgi:membrane-bound lytic murein transglycosylase D